MKKRKSIFSRLWKLIPALVLVFSGVAIVGAGEALASYNCGDGIINASNEECDDGGTEDGDGCSSNCKIEECKYFGYDTTIAKWEWNGGWSSDGNANGTSVTGSDTAANWNIGTSGADGIVVKGGNVGHGGVLYWVDELNGFGTVNQDNPAISHITFCGNEIEKGSISGKKFKDVNGDGDLADGVPLKNWTIFIDENGNGIKDSGETETKTDSNGYYEFSNLVQGEYTVCEVLENEWKQTYPGGNGCHNNETVIPGQISPVLNFGNFKYGKISGYKFNDLDNNGSWDEPNELGLESWTIKLSFLDLQNTPNCPEGKVEGKYCKLQTNKDGYYIFRGLDHGIYIVEEENQPGWTQTYPDVPGTYEVTINSGSVKSKKIFGNYQEPQEPESFSICGTKYHDSNADGVWNEGELGIENWEIKLFWNMASVAEEPGFIEIITTDENGNYCFTGLTSGEYIVTEENREGWHPSSETSISVSLIEGNSNGNNFFNYQNGLISGFKFNDLNGNGVWNTGEEFLADWEICLNGKKCVLTDENGYFEFADLKPGIYSLTEVMQAGWAQTASPDPINLSSGEKSKENDFGNRGALKINGHKYSDLNGNGKKNAGEPALKGWKIILYKDGVKIAETTTNKNGYYSFLNLEPGDYKVREVERDGWSATSNVLVVIARMTANTTVNFFNQPDPDLEIIKVNDVSSYVNSGSEVTYVVIITNDGIGAATNFKVIDVLPDGFSYIEGSSIIIGATGTEPVVDGQTLIWTINSLAPGEFLAIIYRVLVGEDVEEGVYVNAVSVEDEQDDSEVTVRIPAILAASTEKKEKGKVLGATVETGSSINTVLILCLVFSLLLISLRALRKKFSFQFARIGVLAAFFFVFSCSFLIAPVAMASDFSIQKLGNVKVINAGEKMTYAAIIQNGSNEAKADFKVKNFLPDGFSYILDTGKVSINGIWNVDNAEKPTMSNGVLIWKIGRLEPGNILSITYEVSINKDVKSGKYKNEVYSLGASDSFEVEVKKVKVLGESTEKELSPASSVEASQETESDLESESKEAVSSTLTEVDQNDSDEKKNEDKKEEEKDEKKDSDKEDKELTEEELETGQSVVKGDKKKDEEGDSSSLIFVLVILFLAAVALTYFEIRKLKKEKEGADHQPHLWE